MSFGFSAGDFISALELVGTVINALKESGDSVSEYREVINELYSLETALLRVKSLELDEEQRSEYTSLRHAAAQCQWTIDLFWKKTSKYQKHLRCNGSGGSRTVAGWMKIKWALCKRDDVARFKADLAAHASSINILLTAIQVHQLNTQDKKRQQEHTTLLGTVQQLTLQCMTKFVGITSTINDGVTHGLVLVQTTARILQTNIQIFSVVCAIQNILTRIPNQVDRQQPVFMIDALGRETPFHLEFIRSAEALKAVLKLNFEKVPSGKRKIDNNEFVLQDLVTEREIDLSRDWDICFLPGQRVDMRMVFEQQNPQGADCPGCRAACSGQTDKNIECPKCGLTFKRVTEVNETTERNESAQKSNGVSSKSPLLPNPPVIDEASDIQFYRRIRLLERKRLKGKPWSTDISIVIDIVVKKIKGSRAVCATCEMDLSGNSAGTSKSNHIRHAAMHARSSIVHKCTFPDCDKSFGRKDNLTGHMRKVHEYSNSTNSNREDIPSHMG